MYIQTCSEMVIPIGIGNDTMFEPIPFNLTRYAEGCKEQYGVSPRPHWVTTYYGGHVSALLSSLRCKFHMYSLLYKRYSMCCNFYKKFAFNCIDTFGNFNLLWLSALDGCCNQGRGGMVKTQNDNVLNC